MSTYNEILQTGRELLKQQGIADANVDAWYLLAHVCKINRTEFLLRSNEAVDKASEEAYLQLIRKRMTHIPLQHITGTQEFMGLEFDVNRHVLVPRQDTETLVQEVLKVCEGKSVLDMCTGSGCIAISIAKLGKPSRTVGVDISAEALELAVGNARKHIVEVEFLQSDLFDQVEGQFDIIVSNPPYIPTKEIDDLMPEVRDYEPRTALDGSPDGLLFYRRITSALAFHLKAHGYVFYEIGHNQGEEVRQILAREGFTQIRVIKDLSGLDRVVCAVKGDI